MIETFDVGRWEIGRESRSSGSEGVVESGSENWVRGVRSSNLVENVSVAEVTGSVSLVTLYNGETSLTQPLHFQLH